MGRTGAGALVIMAAIAAAPLRAQAPEAARPQFDVASVKPNRSGGTDMRFDVQPGGRVIIANIPLLQLIRAAYTLQLYQIVNAPSWAASARFDISAVSDRDLTGATWKPGNGYAPLQLMLQALLADRFTFVAHHDTRETQVYSLVIDKADRSHLRPAARECAGGCGMHLGPGTLAARRVPLPQLAELLSQVTGRVVTDATGLQGNFDFDLQWATDHAQQAPDDAPSIFTAVKEQLGLRLDSKRGHVPVLVIDSVQQPSAD